MKSEWLLRREIVAVGRQLHARGLIAGTDGNLSVRVLPDRFLVTPAGSALNELRPEDLLYVDADATVLVRPSPGARPTSELPMHLAAYAERPEIGAVIHAHPPSTTALTLAGVSLAAPVLPELLLAFGSVPTAPYATPSTDAGARAIRELIRTHDAILLERHGAVTVGRDLAEARHRMEQLEQAARILLAAHAAGPLRPLPAEEIAHLRAMRAPR
jgi:L-fuculose-phosphate aldolase